MAKVGPTPEGCRTIGIGPSREGSEATDIAATCEGYAYAVIGISPAHQEVGAKATEIAAS